MARDPFSDVRIDVLPRLHLACPRAVRLRHRYLAGRTRTRPAGYGVWAVVPRRVRPAAEVAVREFAGGLHAVMTIADPFSAPLTWIPEGCARLRRWVRRMAPAT